MSATIRTMYLHITRNGAGSVTIGEAGHPFNKIVIEVHNRNWDMRAFLGLSPEQARDIAAELIRRADMVEGGPS